MKLGSRKSAQYGLPVARTGAGALHSPRFVGSFVRVFNSGGFRARTRDACPPDGLGWGRKTRD